MSDVGYAEEEAAEAAPAFGYNIDGDIPEGMLGGAGAGGGEGDKEGMEGGGGVGNVGGVGFTRSGSVGGSNGKLDSGEGELLNEKASLVIPGAVKMKGGIAGKDDKIHIIVTPVEQQSMTQLQERLDLCETLIEDVQSSFDGLRSHSNEVKQKIAERVKSIVQMLQEKEKGALGDIEQKKQEKEVMLKSQLKYLQNHEDAINNSKRRYQELVADVDKNVHERRVEIVSMCSSLLNDKQVTLNMITTPALKFGFQSDALKQFYKKITIDDCDQPPPPMQLKALKIGPDSISLEWKMLELAENKPLLELSVEAALLPGEFVGEKTKRDTGSEKKSSKKKEKKK